MVLIGRRGSGSSSKMIVGWGVAFFFTTLDCFFDLNTGGGFGVTGKRGGRGATGMNIEPGDWYVGGSGIETDNCGRTGKDETG